MGKIIAVTNQKGGVGKTTSAANIGIGNQMAGKKVLLVDFDPSGDLSTVLGFNTDFVEKPISYYVEKIISRCPIDGYEPLVGEAGIHLIPSNEDLANLEFDLVNATMRESVLRKILDPLKDQYDYIFIDCPPSFGMLTVNAMAAADYVLITCQTEFLSSKAMEKLLRTIIKIKNSSNPALDIYSVLLTMTSHTKFSQFNIEQVREQYGSNFRVFQTSIPRSIKCAEATCMAQSIFKYEKDSVVALAYQMVVSEMRLIDNELEASHE